MSNQPKTLQDAIVYFADADNFTYIVERRWPDGVSCPTCGRSDVSFVAKRRVWQCKTRHPKAQFSVKVGTIFEDSPLGLDKWLPAVWMIANCKNGISSWELHRALGVTQKTAWFMLHRIRLAKRRARITGTGGKDKAAVLGMVERGGKVRAAAVDSRSRAELQGRVRESVQAGAAIFTDEFLSYVGLNKDYEHAVINHAVEYVNGEVHTNTIENFWSLLKRGLHGTYVSVEPFHLFRYLDEQTFRYNNRKDMNDGDRFSLAVSQVTGKRLTYAELTGKVSETTVETIN